MSNEWLLQGGLVCDGSGAPPFRGDVLLKDGVIAAVERSEDAAGTTPKEGQLFPAQDYIVVPGLIDLHVHVYDGMNLHSVAASEIGLKTGVTTLLDTGSAGAMNFGTFSKYVIPAARERIFTLLNISYFGVQGHPEIPPYIGDLHDAAHFDVPAALRCIRAHPAQILGVKVRLTASLADDDPQKERAALQAALQVRDESGMPLMVHHVMSSIPVDELCAVLQKGDILTHVYHGMGDGGFTANDGAPSRALEEARSRGVILDVGHGSGSFSWSVAEAACTSHNFWPDTISSDLHLFNLSTPVVDLPTTMSKFLHLGMKLEEVVSCATSKAAQAMNQPDLGILRAGAPAEVTVLQVAEGPHVLLDSDGIERFAERRLVPICVFKDGQKQDCTPSY